MRVINLLARLLLRGDGNYRPDLVLGRASRSLLINEDNGGVQHRGGIDSCRRRP